MKNEGGPGELAEQDGRVAAWRLVSLRWCGNLASEIGQRACWLCSSRSVVAPVDAVGLKRIAASRCLGLEFSLGRDRVLVPSNHTTRLKRVATVGSWSALVLHGSLDRLVIATMHATGLIRGCTTWPTGSTRRSRGLAPQRRIGLVLLVLGTQRGNDARRCAGGPLHGLVERLAEIGNEVSLFLQSNTDANQVVGDAQTHALVRGNRRVGHDRRMIEEALDSTKGLGQGENLARLEESLGLAKSALDAEGNHAAEAAALLRHDLKPRVRRETWINDLLDLLGVLQVERNRDGVCLVQAHASMQSLETAIDEEAIEGAGARTASKLDEAQAGSKRIITQNAHAHHDIAVTVDVLGDRVEGNVSAKLERPLEVRRHKRVVRDENNSRVLGHDIGNCADVNHLQQWVRRRFDPHKLGLRGDGTLNVLRDLRVDKGEGETKLAGNEAEKATSASIEIIVGNDMVAGLEQLQTAHGGRQPRAEGDAVLARLERSKGLFEAVARRVARSRIIPSSMDAGCLLGESS
eukprot:m.453963 g.453963  ORF g.453963 m.453963 type:complete len:520 (-) comp56942_c0_seq1:105-1664(-)